MLPSEVAFLHEGFGFFEGGPVDDGYFKVAGSPVADLADVAGEAGFEGVLVRVEFEVEGYGFVGCLHAGEVFDLFEGEVEFFLLFGDIVAEAADVVGSCVKEFAGLGVDGCFSFGEGFVFG